MEQTCRVGSFGPHPDMALRFSFRHWLRDFACEVDENLRHRREGAVFQCDDPYGSARCRQIDWQGLDGRVPAKEFQCKFGSDSEKLPVGDKGDARNTTGSDHGGAGKLKSGGAKGIDGERAEHAIKRWERPG